MPYAECINTNRKNEPARPAVRYTEQQIADPVDAQTLLAVQLCNGCSSKCPIRSVVERAKKTVEAGLPKDEE